jgi:voltage-gated potassium channel
MQPEVKDKNSHCSYEISPIPMNNKDIKWRIYNVIRDDDENDLLSNIIDIIIVSSIFLNILLIILDTFSFFHGKHENILKRIELVLAIIFTIEYLIRIWTSVYIIPAIPAYKARLKYLLTFKGLIDIIALIPFYIALIFDTNFDFLKIIRLFRILSILKINRYTNSLSNVGKVIRNKSAQLISSMFVVSILIIFSSVLMYYIENEAQPEKFNNAFSGLWWAIATLTTVGYGDIYPITVIGKILGVLIAFLGIGLVAVPTGIISAGFVEQISEEKETKKYCPYCGKKIE